MPCKQGGNFCGFSKKSFKICFISDFFMKNYSYKPDSTLEFVFSSIGL